MNENEFYKSLEHIANRLYSINPQENMIKFLEFMHVDNLEYIKNTAKGFRLPFSTEKLNYRSPIARIKLPSDKNLPRVSQLELKRYQSTKNFQYRKTKINLPCDAIVTVIKKNSYSANLIKKLNPMSFTWKTLSSLQGDNFQYDNKLNELLSSNVDSDDEILTKQYGSIKHTPEHIKK